MTADLGAALRALLLEDAALSALVGGVRLYPNVLPQPPTLPAATYVIAEGPDLYHMRGPAGLTQPFATFACWGNTYAEARALKRRVVAVLGGFRGEAGSPPLRIQGCFKSGGLGDEFPTDLVPAGPPARRVDVDFFLTIEE